MIGISISPFFKRGSNSVQDELLLTFNNNTDADLLINGDSSNVSAWNTFFYDDELIVNFTSVEKRGNVINLIGGRNIFLVPLLYTSPYKPINITDTLKEVKYIVLSGVSIDKFPEIDSFTALRYLIVVESSFAVAPVLLDFSGLTSLEDLIIENIAITSPPVLTGLTALKRLILSSTSITSPPVLTGLTALNELNLNGCSGLDLSDIDAVLSFYGTQRENITSVYLSQDPPILPTPATLLAAQTANPQCTFYVDVAE